LLPHLAIVRRVFGGYLEKHSDSVYRLFEGSFRAYFLRAVGFLLNPPTTRYLLPSTYDPLPTTYYLPTTYLLPTYYLPTTYLLPDISLPHYTRVLISTFFVLEDRTRPYRSAVLIAGKGDFRSSV
jgi:hypothetical protein